MAYFNIQEFLAAVDQTGMQRSARFRCRIPISTITSPGIPLQALYPRAAKLLAQGLICESTRTPSRSLETTDMTLYGYEEKYPVFTTYTDLDCTFYTPLVMTPNGASNDVLKIFSAWQSFIHPITPADGSSDSRQEMTLNFPDNYRLREGMVLEMFDNYHPKTSAGGFGVSVGTDVPLIGRVGIGASFGTNREDPEMAPTAVYKFFNVYPVTVESSAVSWSAVGEVQRITVSFAYSYWTLQRTPVVPS